MTSTAGAPSGVVGLIEEARAAERDARYTVARRRYQAALYRLRGHDLGALASALLRWIGRTHAAESDFDAGLDCYRVALSVAEATGARADAAHALNCIAIVHFQRGNLDEATARYEEAREVAREAGERRLLAMIDQNLGNVANVRGDHERAYSRYLSSLRAYRELGLEEYVGPLLTNMGRVHTDLEDWDAAERALDEALSSCKSVGNAAHGILVEVNRAHLWLKKGDLTRGRDACEAALEASAQLDEECWLGEIYTLLGTVYLRAGRPRLAERTLVEAMERAEGQESLLLQAEVSREMARLFRSEGRNPEMLACLNRAHRAFAELRAGHEMADVQRRIADLERAFMEIVEEWGTSIESKDRYTQGHCRRVAHWASQLARAVGLDEASLRWFRMGALLHDVGKVEVPSEILNKPGALSGEEWAIMKRHPEAGVELLSDVDFPWDIRPMVLHHHERWDGAGYPHGIAGEEIPLSARILCVADVFDALTTTRSYRAAFTADVALEIMADDAGHVFDPELFDRFRELVGARAPLDPAAWSSADPWGMRRDRPEHREPPLKLLA